MQFYLISDNVDTQVGMRLAGIDGVVVHTYDEVKEALQFAISNNEIAVILITTKLINLCHDLIYDYKLNSPKVLITEIPDRHATTNIASTLSSYIESAIGLKI